MHEARCGRRIYVPVATSLFGAQVEVQAHSPSCGCLVIQRQRAGGAAAAVVARRTAAITDIAEAPGKPPSFAVREAAVRAHDLGKRLTLPRFPSPARTLLCANPAISASQLPPPKGPSPSITAGGE